MTTALPSYTTSRDVTAGSSCCAFLVFVGEHGHPLRSDLDALAPEEPLEIVALVENLTRREAGPLPLGRGEPAAPQFRNKSAS